MLKIIILFTVILILFTLENHKRQKEKTPTQYTKTIKSLHLIGGIFITLIATVHGIGHLKDAVVINLITGMIILILLYLEIIIGIILNRKAKSFNPILKTLHNITPIITICVIILHILLRKGF